MGNIPRFHYSSTISAANLSPRIASLISALEIGPGPKSLFGHLPEHLRWKIRELTVFEPNDLFATRLEEWLRYCSETESPLPYLEISPNIHRIPFFPQDKAGSSTRDNDKRYHIILFCHSMYVMKPTRLHRTGVGTAC